MKYFVFLDHFDLWAMISGMIGRSDDQVVIKTGVPPGQAAEDFPVKTLDVKTLDASWIAGLNIMPEDRIIICAREPETFHPVINSLSETLPAPNILMLTGKSTAMSTGARPNVAVINVPAMVQENLTNEWRLIDIRQKAYSLWRTLSDADRVLIMTQNDPDPDAIASAMAIQTLISGDTEKTPIATFGQVTRNENVAMLQLLRTDVKTIEPHQVREYDKVVMVDVQPPYFEPGTFDKVDAVIDHHPSPADYDAEFKDVNVSYGATATMMCEYLTAGGITISQKLATALLYGVITDTMLLSRGSSTHDFEAFALLWPMANQQLLASMSRPRLKPEELSYFVRAIHNRKIIGDFLYIWLGNIKKEDIIPRLADFSLQIGDSAISAVCGVYDQSVVISIRNIGLGANAGELAAELFSEYGPAGGHHSMAKAVISLDKFKKTHHIKSLKQINETVQKIFRRRLAP